MAPGVAAVIDDVVMAREDAVREPNVAQEAPDVFDRVELRCTRRQGHECDVFEHFEPQCGAPSDAVENEDGMGADSDRLGDLTQMDLHGGGIAKGQDPGSSRAPLGADGAKEMGPCGALIMGRARAGSAPRPAPAQLVLLTGPHFILEPDLDRRA